MTDTILRRCLVKGGLDGNIDRLAAAAAIHDIAHVFGTGFHQRFRQRRPRQRREMVVADVEHLGAALQRFHQLRIAMAEVKCAAVEVEIDQPLAREVIDEITLAAADHEIDAEILPGLGLTGIPMGLGSPELSWSHRQTTKSCMGSLLSRRQNSVPSLPAPPNSAGSVKSMISVCRDIAGPSLAKYSAP
jgi:hypothetical protein